LILHDCKKVWQLVILIDYCYHKYYDEDDMNGVATINYWLTTISFEITTYFLYRPLVGIVQVPVRFCQFWFTRGSKVSMHSQGHPSP